MGTIYDDDDLEILDLEQDKDIPDEKEIKDASDNEIYEETDPEDDTEDTDTEKDSTKYIHIIFGIVAVVLLAASTILLVKWHQGIDLVITEDDLTENYYVESEDFYINFDPAKIPGYVDDGEYNIVILGDDSIYYNNDETGIPAVIASLTGANVTTLALPGSTIGLQEKSYTLEYPEEAYNLYYIVNSITAGDMGNYDLMMSAWDHMEDTLVYYEYWDKLHVIDFDKVDVLIIAYGTNDYLLERPFTGDDVYSQQIYGHENSLDGSLDDCLQMLTARFPQMQILVSSPNYFFTTDENGESIGVDLYNNGYGNLGEYVLHMKSVSQLQRVTFIDNYFGSEFSATNYEGYLTSDGLYPNEEGRRAIAEHITEYIYFMRQ